MTGGQPRSLVHGSAVGGALADGYDLLLFDLDGVVYVGDQAVDGAPGALRQLRRKGLRTCYVTNNASRSAEAVADLLTSLDVPAHMSDVVTSAQAAAELLAERIGPKGRVLIVGAPSLADEVAKVGLTPVTTAAQEPVAVVQGYSADVGWRLLAEAAIPLARGALWVATNTDRTVPSPRGPLPGNGALVAALSVAVNRSPDLVAGKPEPGLFNTAIARWGADRPLVVGDRLDTDIEGAVRSGHDSVFVLTGVGTAADLLAAPAAMRPRYVANGLADLLQEYPTAHVAEGLARCRDWTASTAENMLRLAGHGDPIDALRVLCAAVWSRRDTTRQSLTVAGAEAAGVLNQLDLSEGERF